MEPTPARILIAEDDPNIRNLLESYLAVSGFATEVVANGDRALERLAERKYDLAVLDIMLPGADGLEICRQLRHRQVPVLLLTALGEEDDRLKGFSAGADDYLVKPFSPRELVARVGAILRRYRPQVLATGHPIAIDWAAKTVSFQGRSLSLTRSEFAILAAMMRRPGVVFSREQLLDVLYPDGESVVPKVVDVHIYNIRKKLGPDGAKLLHTVRGFGYRIARSGDDGDTA